MTTILLIAILAIAVVGFVALRSGRDRRVEGVGWARAIMIVGLIPLGLQALVFTLFGVGEMASGDLSGAGHLVSLAVTVVLGFLAWKRPVEGGFALLVVGVATLTEFRDATARMIMAAPQVVSGALFLVGGAGGWASSRRGQSQGTGV